MSDAMVFGGLRSVAGFIDQVAADRHKCRLQPVRRGDREFEIRRLLREILIFRVHSELRVGHLQEEEFLGHGGERTKEGKY